ncbi:hypothetical protein AA310_12225 [Arthrobacter sp. YC-RL1]|uniref:hypothetical protein n=1 Tax=Arthrobacter sp. YC-RL1 TaxID=1652545 RepID=UPI00063D8C1B|nr:hypothetical protein [Arthrobacter sp. YC-RL1]ALQ30120.1 hypothetical protein ATC04_05805 [Arthrobacter sp. YC-RL1]KLI88557.1 hypothetical protein AA310_12225 [Arthrobacter sp. YC-RL1]
MPVSKSRKGGRSTKKQYSFVKFEFEGFNDPFELPSFEQMPIGIIEAMEKGNISKIVGWLDSAGVDKSTLDDFRELSQEEVMPFTEAWGNGQPVGLGNSES